MMPTMAGKSQEVPASQAVEERHQIGIVNKLEEGNYDFYKK